MVRNLPIVSAPPASTIERYVKVYNQHITQKALGHIPPLEAMKKWSQKQPQLFKKGRRGYVL